MRATYRRQSSPATSRGLHPARSSSERRERVVLRMTTKSIPRCGAHVISGAVARAERRIHPVSRESRQSVALRCVVFGSVEAAIGHAAAILVHELAGRLLAQHGGLVAKGARRARRLVVVVHVWMVAAHVFTRESRSERNPVPLRSLPETAVKAGTVSSICVSS